MNINKDRLWEREMRLGHIGDDPAGGVSRFAWTPEYKEAMDLLSEWMRDARLIVRTDTVGNLFGRLEGSDPTLAPVLVGSHLDTVPSGGCFDGVAGIMSALESLVTMREQGIVPERSIELVAFINEEASQFLGGCFGSKAMCGMIEENYPDICCNRHTGQTLREAMLEFGGGLDPDAIIDSKVGKDDYFAYLEVHIEQGKYLLQRNKPVAVVTSIAGIKQFYITIEGVSCHAGGMAMEDRHDAMAAAVAVAAEVERLALTSGSATRGTVGYIHSEPGEQNIVAGRCVVSVDYREDQDDIWEDIFQKLISFTKEQCAKRGLTYSVNTTIDTAPAHCHPAIIDLLEHTADELDIPCMRMVSYPAHDAMQLERLFPIGMIFLRSLNDGRSHCPEEYTSKEDLAAGAELLFNALCSMTKGNYIL